MSYNINTKATIRLSSKNWPLMSAVFSNTLVLEIMIPRQGEQCPVVIISYMSYSPPKCTCHGKTFTLKKLGTSPRVSYTHIEISDISPDLLHSHRNSGYLPGSLTPTQKFGTSPRVSYTHTEISDISSGLLHPHRNSGYIPGSLTPTQKFGIFPRVSYTNTEIWDISLGLLHPHRTFRMLPRVSFTLIPGFSP